MNLFKTKRQIQHQAKVIEDKIESDCDGEGAFPVSGEIPKDKWLVDSSASSHMTPKREYFTWYQSLNS